MHYLTNRNVKRVFAFLGIFIAVSVISLWSFNTLSGLFDGPQAQYKHVIAVFGLALGMRFCGSAAFHRHHSRRSTA